MKLRNGILALTLASAVALPSIAANAADVYRPGPGGYKDEPAYVGVNWSGFYIGVNGGFGSTANTDSDFDLNPSGGFAGGQIGYNWQGGFGLSHSWVFGIEADVQGADISDRDVLGDKSRMDAFGTVRGRLGYAFGPALLYGTGGFAWGNVSSNFPGIFSASETQTGWAAGGGIEYKLNPAWSVKAEYQFISLDASSFSGPGALGAPLKDRTEVDTVRVGVNYHFGPGYAPLK